MTDFKWKPFPSVAPTETGVYYLTCCEGKETIQMYNCYDGFEFAVDAWSELPSICRFCWNNNECYYTKDRVLLKGAVTQCNFYEELRPEDDRRRNPSEVLGY